MTKLDWEQHRAEIERLYLSENKHLHEVVVVMKSSADFHASKQSYERKLRQWGIRKHRKREEWRAVIRETKRRQELNKANEVFLGPRLCSQAKLRKEFARHGYKSTFDRMRFVARQALHPSKSQKTSLYAPPGHRSLILNGVATCHGLNLGRGFKCKHLHYLMITPGQNLLVLFPSPWTSFSDRLLDQSSTSLANLYRGIIPLSCARLKAARVRSAMISLIMPEEYDGQNCRAVGRLYGLQKNEAISEFVMLQLFFLSNNFMPWEEGSAYFDQETVQAHDERVIGILQAFGPLDCAHFLKQVVSSSKATSTAISEQLFASILRVGNMKLLEIMLEAGIDTNTLIDYPGCEDGWAAPLEVAAGLSHSVSLEAVRLLLNHLPKDNRQTSLKAALGQAVYNRHGELFDLLVASGAVAQPCTLAGAICSGDDTILRKVLDTGVDINADVRDFDDESYDNHDERTPIGLATHMGYGQMMRTLLEYDADIERPLILKASTLPPIRRGQLATPIAIATARGDTVCIRTLLQANACVNPADDSYACPLVLACYRRDGEGIMDLLDAGADVSYADKRVGQDTGSSYQCLIDVLIDHEQRDIQIWKLLLTRGAHIDSSTLLVAIQEKIEAHFVVLLLDYEAPQKCSPGGNCAFGAALESGQVDIARVLLSAGAPLTIQIDRIGNMETAVFLEKVGLLDTLVARNGVKILLSAIESCQWRLTDGLLQLGIQLNPSNCPNSKATTLPEAAFAEGNSDLARCLIERGACITGALVPAAVWGAVLSENDDLLRFALQIAQSTDAARSWLGEPYSCTAIDMAIRSGNCTLVRLLLDTGADPRGRPVSDGNSPFAFFQDRFRPPKFSAWWHNNSTYPRGPMSVLDAAVTYEDIEILQMLLKKWEWKRHCTGSAVITAINKGRHDLVQDFLDAGAAPDHIYGSKGVLQSTVYLGRTDLLRNLIQAGADVNKRTKGSHGRTALQIAVDKGNWEATRILLEAYADVDAPAAEMGATALQFAAAKGYLRIARSLLNAHADINAPGAEIHGRTALEAAAEHGRVDMLHLLLTRGARIDGDGRGQYIRAVKFAKSRGHNAAAKMLKHQGNWNDEDSVQYTKESIADHIDPDELFDQFGEFDPFSLGLGYDSDPDSWSNEEEEEEEEDDDDDNDDDDSINNDSFERDFPIEDTLQNEWDGSEQTSHLKDHDAQTSAPEATLEDSTGFTLNGEMDCVFEATFDSNPFWQAETDSLSATDTMPEMEWEPDLRPGDFFDFSEDMMDISSFVPDFNGEFDTM